MAEDKKNQKFEYEVKIKLKMLSSNFCPDDQLEIA